MTLSDQLQQRTDLIGTQVITRDTGKKLGVINQLWVDIDQQEVAALGLRSTLFTGEQRYMFLSSIRQVGDVILVEDEDAIEEIDVYNFSSLINNEVITETGELLGKVRGFKFDVDTGKLSDLVIASFGLPWIPAQLLSTYELPVTEIVSSGAERLIVFEGAEERLNQLTVGVMERLGIGAAPWEREEEDYYQPPASTGNQLGAGSRTPAYNPPRRNTRPVEEVWEEPPARRNTRQESWQEEPWPPEEPPARQVKPQRRQPVYEDDYDEVEEEDNWATPAASDRPARESRPAPNAPDHELEDAWADDQPYEAPKVNIPERRKVTEYEQEPEY
jgi:sporulation protein YlmC with PRC-barrel domain